MKSLITDEQTDAVCFSSLLTRFRLWKELQQILLTEHIPYTLIPDTCDIWVRDFMPIQTFSDRFLKFAYHPSYLKDLPDYRTDWTDSCTFDHDRPSAGEAEEAHRCTPIPVLDLNLDGGNVIKCENCVILTDRIFRENRHTPKSVILDRLERLFSCEILIIPSDPNEATGHADGMVRYIGNGTVLLNHYADYDPELRRQLLKALTPKFAVTELHYGTNLCPNTNWAYLNYLQVGRLILAPSLHERLDEIALPQLETVFHTHIHTVPALGAVRIGGGLNCLSWTTKGLVRHIAPTDTCH